MITAIQPEVKPLGRYTSKEACLMLGIHPNTMRQYVLKGYIDPIPQKPGIKGVRYMGHEIIKLWKYMTGGSIR